MDKVCVTCSQLFHVSPSRSHIKNCSYICNKVWRQVNQVALKPLSSCQCGCGVTVRSHRSKYIFGHSPKMSAGQTNSGSFKGGHEGMQQEKNPNWRGGFIMRNGYKARRIKGRKIYQHRYVMEQELGRRLSRLEHVHHINHDKLDNRPENLIVLNPSEHAKYHANVMWGNLEKVGG